MTETALERQLRMSLGEKVAGPEMTAPPSVGVDQTLPRLEETASMDPNPKEVPMADTNTARMTAIPWPSPDSVSIGPKGYDTPDGTFPRTTSITKLLGTGTDALIRWGAETEHDACIEAACEVYAGPDELSVGEFKREMELRLGAARAHIKKLAKAGDIGSAIHDMIRWTLMTELGQDSGPKPSISQEAGWGFMSWQVWWEKEKTKGAHPIRVEQPIWNKRLAYAGTIDFIAAYPDGLDLLDWKSSTGIYDNHHLQVTGYAMAARELLGIEFRRRRIVRVPKVVGDLEVYEKEVGDLTYDYISKKDGKRKQGGRSLTAAQLEAAFTACRTLYSSFGEAP